MSSFGALFLPVRVRESDTDTVHVDRGGRPTRKHLATYKFSSFHAKFVPKHYFDQLPILCHDVSISHTAMGVGFWG